MTDKPRKPSRKAVYTGEVVDLGIESVVLPNGHHIQLEVVRHPGGAAVVALDDQRRVCLLRQYRHAAGGWLWELPAGKIDRPEPPEQTAQRELREEAGLLAGEWTHLGSFLSTPGFCDERIHLYLARSLRSVATELHAHEVIEVHWLDYAQALERLRAGEIEDGKTIIGLLLARPFLE
ncbi:MAG: NUDIX hydrolase [Gammaproteobacteria bacterium]|jgi:ADP-ribose pyrophosphatase